MVDGERPGTLRDHYHIMQSEGQAMPLGTATHLHCVAQPQPKVGCAVPPTLGLAAEFLEIQHHIRIEINFTFGEDTETSLPSFTLFF